MTQALERSVLARGVRVRENLLAYRILTEEKGVCGLECLDLRDNTVLRIRCAQVILATGRAPRASISTGCTRRASSA